MAVVYYYTTMFFSSSTVEPHFLDVPENQEFIRETDAVMECPAFFGDPPGTMIWTLNKSKTNVDVGIMHERFITEDGRLTILNIHNGDEGVYRCAINRLGIVRVDSRFITVGIVERDNLAPRIIEPLNPIEVVYWDSLDLNCLLEVQRDDVYYTWI